MCGLVLDEFTRLAARLVGQAHRLDAHAAIHRLAHVVHGERRDDAAVSASISTPVCPVVRTVAAISTAVAGHRPVPARPR